MNRPTGVTVLGWIAIVFGAIGLLAAIAGGITAMGLLFGGAGLAGAGSVAGGAALAGGATLLLLLTVWIGVLSAIEIAFGVGALQLRPWAWTLGMIWAWISIGTTLLSLISNRGSGVFNALLSLFVALAILYYLYTEEVRAAFGKSDKHAPSFIAPFFAWIDKTLGGGRGGRPQTPGGYQPPQAPSGPVGPGPQAPAHYDAPAGGEGPQAPPA